MIKILKDQQNILYVCPTLFWGTRERMVLRDMEIAREVGHYPFLYCLKDSPLHLEAKQRGIDCFFHQGKKKVKFINWFSLGELKSLFTRLDINIVHCYSLNFLWPISYFLRKEPKISLVQTISHDLKKYYTNFWYKPLVSRIDLILLPMKEMLESVRGHMEIPKMKVDICGLGLSFNHSNLEEKKDDEFWQVGVFIGSHEENTSSVLPVFRALSGLISSSLSDRNFKFHILSDREWDHFVIFPEIQRYIIENGLQDHVEFVRAKSVEEYQRSLHLWFGANHYEAIEDYTMTALSNGIPVIVPRNPSSMELFRMLGPVGRTYKKGDARELKARCLELLNNLELVSDNLSRVRPQLEQIFGLECYKNQILTLYEKTLNKRYRKYHR